MQRGGARPGAGRPKGSKNEWKALIDKPILNGILPLDFLLAVVASPDAPVALRMAAAKEAAPYVHRKLAPLPVQPKEVEAEQSHSSAVRGWEDDLVDLKPN